MEHIKRTLVMCMIVAGILALVLVPSSVVSAQDKKLDLALCDPGTADFSAPLDIDNPYVRYDLVGREWTLVGDEDDETIGLKVRVTASTEEVAGIQTREVEEVEWEDDDGDGVIDPGENLIEVSINFFAQTDDGTVCYFGEEVTDYEDGVPLPGPGEGAWRANDPGNFPGIFFPAVPVAPGMIFQQEGAPDIAEDEAKIIEIGPVEVPFGMFEQDVTVRLREWNPLEHEKDYKVFAAGTGILKDAELELVDLTHF